MIIFREKLFRRDKEPDFYDLLKDDPKMVEIYGPSKTVIVADKLYNDQMRRLGIAIDKARVKKLRDDIKVGAIYYDGPNGGDTHYLGDYSKPGKFYTFSKVIDEKHRLNYKVYPPKVQINEKTKEKEYIKKIILESCWEHNTKEGDYLNDKNLRARKDRMRGNAPYRNKTSILSKKKHGNNRTNTKRT